MWLKQLENGNRRREEARVLKNCHPYYEVDDAAVVFSVLEHRVLWLLFFGKKVKPQKRSPGVGSQRLPRQDRYRMRNMGMSCHSI
jgi:hypothetical protein